MSGQLTLWDDGLGGFESKPDNKDFRASLGREISYLLTISKNAGRGSRLSSSGIAYSLTVCMIEVFNMARGKGGSSASVQNGNLPTFIDVKMTPEDRERFSAWYAKSGDRTAELIKLADNGYRVGIAWSGEHQSYTVSVTCRDSGSPNNGMCMTSFAKDLEQAVALAWYKCDVICAWEWAKYKPTPSELFG